MDHLLVIKRITTCRTDGDEYLYVEIRIEDDELIVEKSDENDQMIHFEVSRVEECMSGVLSPGTDFDLFCLKWSIIISTQLFRWASESNREVIMKKKRE